VDANQNGKKYAAGLEIRRPGGALYQTGFCNSQHLNNCNRRAIGRLTLATCPQLLVLACFRSLVVVFTLEQNVVRRHIRIVPSSNPAVRTRKSLDEVVSWNAAVLIDPNHLKNDLPKKQSACELKPNCFLRARDAMK
jgi:hypothetical protein